MNTVQRFRISLPQDMAQVVQQKIQSGAYASVSDVVSDGVRTLLERDAAAERWLRGEVVKGHADYLTDPSKAIPAADILGRIKERRAPKVR